MTTLGFLDTLAQPFIMGLCIGLIFAVWAWANGALSRRDLRRDADRLKEHLNTQMAINSRGQNETLKELEKLRKENENLRITNASLKQKPGRQELHQLQVYDRALRTLFQKAPGFSAAWESAVREAEQEVEKTESGLLPLVRKLFNPGLLNSGSKKESAAEEIQEAGVVESPAKPEGDSTLKA